MNTIHRRRIHIFTYV